MIASTPVANKNKLKTNYADLRKELGILSPIKDSSHSSLLNSDKKSREKSEKNLSWDNYDIGENFFSIHFFIFHLSHLLFKKILLFTFSKLF